MRRTMLAAAVALSVGMGFIAAQQPPAPGAGGPAGGGRGGRVGGLPGATPDQLQAVNDMSAALAPLAAAVTTARNELATATFAAQKNEAAIKAAVDKLKSAELA